jgi:phosphoglucosamine mutase
MSNLGLEKALRDLEIAVVRCDVGDRTVVATMREHAIRLGGEQSGHLVDLAESTTGDGLSTALKMVSILKQSGQPLSRLLSDFRRFPQVLVNVEVASKPVLESLPAVRQVASEVEEALGDDGRLVLRYSGTEPLARVMIEGPEMNQIEDLATRLVDVIRDAIGAPAP